MNKISTFKYVISSLICFIIGNSAYASTYVSLSPNVTEIIYALNAQDNLLAVSSSCNYPDEVKNKQVIGDNFFVNTELLIKLQPDYIFAMESAKPKIMELNITKTKPIFFEYSNIEQIYDSINHLANLTNKKDNANKLIQDIKQKIEKNKTTNPKRILYVVQTNPMITIGNKSFITDIIKKSGHITVSENLPYAYPAITLEYAIKTNPDIIITAFCDDKKVLRNLFPKAKIYYLTKQEQDLINRCGPRVYEAIRLFAQLDFKQSD